MRVLKNASQIHTPVFGGLSAAPPGALKIKKSPRLAQKYCNQAWALLDKNKGISRNKKAYLRTCICDNNSIIAETIQQLPDAVRHLDAALKYAPAQGELRVDDTRVKYLYIKRALLHARQNDYALALHDLDRALAHGWHNKVVVEVLNLTDILELDEIIYWERVKIYLKIKNFTKARECLSQLINFTQINLDNWHSRSLTALPPDLIARMRELYGLLPAEDSVEISPEPRGYQPPPARPEAPANYDSFQPNPKCPQYQEFIAKIMTKPKKTLRELEYLVAFKFSIYQDNREYAKDVAPVTKPRRGTKKYWWTPGLRDFFLTREYRQAAQFFAHAVKQTPTLLGYELAGKAYMASGQHKKAIKLLTKGIKGARAAAAAATDKYPDQLQMKILLLMRGIAYGKVLEPAAALKDYNTALRLVPSHNFLKLGSILLWERARLYLARGEVSVAIKGLKEIGANYACHEYIARLRGTKPEE